MVLCVVRCYGLFVVARCSLLLFVVVLVDVVRCVLLFVDRCLCVVIVCVCLLAFAFVICWCV